MMAKPQVCHQAVKKSSGAAHAIGSARGSSVRRRGEGGFLSTVDGITIPSLRKAIDGGVQGAVSWCLR